MATAASERRWLALANELTVRELSRAVREHSRRKGDSGAAEPDPDEPRAAWRAEVPGWMIGKTNSVLRLVNKVAGTPLPEGARWEFIAAEFLSGALALEEDSDATPVEKDSRERRVEEDSGMTSSEEDPGSTSVEEKPGATPVGEDPGPALGAESVNAGGATLPKPPRRHR